MTQLETYIVIQSRPSTYIPDPSLLFRPDLYIYTLRIHGQS